MSDLPTKDITNLLVQSDGHLAVNITGARIDREESIPYTAVKRQNIPAGEFALRRGAPVEATDGYVGQVDGLLIDSNTMQVTHLLLLERHIFQAREITIPVSQIDHLDEGTIYLKLDRQSVEALPTTPVQRWPQDDSPGPRLFPL